MIRLSKMEKSAESRLEKLKSSMTIHGGNAISKIENTCDEGDQKPL
jgi:hypothetical protein